MSSSDTSISEVDEQPAAVANQPWKTRPWLIVVTITAILALQLWSTTDILRRTAEVQAALSEAHDTVSRLEKSIGYGGLIHNFKNYVLRSDEESYRLAALKNAREAFGYLERLRRIAGELDMDVSFGNAHNMLVTYTKRLESVRVLAARGDSPSAIDRQVRFDDGPVIEEVETVLDRMDAVFEGKLHAAQYRRIMTAMLCTAGTALLGLFLFNVFARWQRWQRQREREQELIADTLKTDNDDLYRVNASLSQFAGIVSHDLKAPARNINTLNLMVAEDRFDAAAVMQHTDRIHAQVLQMNLIIDSLLEFTQFGFAQPKVEQVDIRDFFVQLVDGLNLEIEQGADIEYRVEVDRPVAMDRQLMARVFGNLIGNSLKYRLDDIPPHIVVCARLDDDRVVFSVTDNGIGIEPKFAQKIFEPMIRLHGAQSMYKGVGLGLSLVKTIIESHQGLVWLDTDYTAGTCIKFSIPVSAGYELKIAA